MCVCELFFTLLTSVSTDIRWRARTLHNSLVKSRWTIQMVQFLRTNKGIITIIFLINVESTLTDFEKFHPPQKKSTLHKKNPPSTFIDIITKVSDFIAEPNDNFSYSHFEL